MEKRRICIGGLTMRSVIKHFSKASTIDILEMNPQKYTRNSIFVKYFLILFVIFAIVFCVFMKIITSNVIAHKQNEEIMGFQTSASRAEYCVGQLLNTIGNNYSILDKMQSFNSILTSKSNFNDLFFIDAYEDVYGYLGSINIYNPKIDSVYVYSAIRKYVYAFGIDAVCSNEVDNFFDKSFITNFESGYCGAIYVENPVRPKKYISLIYTVDNFGCISYNINISEIEKTIDLPMYIVYDNDIVYHPDNAEFETYEDLIDENSGYVYKINFDNKRLKLILKKKASISYFDNNKYVLYFFVVMALAGILAFLISNLLYEYITKICSLIVNPFSNGARIGKSSELNYVANSLKKTSFDKNEMDVKLNDAIKQLNISQATALQLQISPHFLFNTLNLISSISLAEAKKETKITTVVDLLSNMLYTILDTSNLVCSLKDEMIYTKYYISIQKLKYGEFSVVWDIPDTKMNLKIVKFSLQPIIENSIHYGIATAENGEIIISGNESDCGKYYTIQVYNNGIPISAEKANEVNKKILTDNIPTSSIGLWNTNKRLKILLDKECGLKIYSNDNGTIVSITICNS